MNEDMQVSVQRSAGKLQGIGYHSIILQHTEKRRQLKAEFRKHGSPKQTVDYVFRRRMSNLFRRGTFLAIFKRLELPIPTAAEKNEYDREWWMGFVKGYMGVEI